MARYAFSGFIAVAATKTPIILGGGTTVRARLYGFCCSTDGVPTSDQGVEFALRRATALGTTTAVTPSAIDPADVASISTGGSNATVEPTYTAGNAGFDRAINPRATLQWAAYDQLAEFVVPATSANGIGIQILGAGGAAGNFRADFSFRE